MQHQQILVSCCWQSRLQDARDAGLAGRLAEHRQQFGININRPFDGRVLQVLGLDVVSQLLNVLRTVHCSVPITAANASLGFN
ncbi:hypothetical protein [Polaromonas glacialis]